MTHRLYNMTFAGVYQSLVAKAERKGRSAQEVHQVTAWLTGYSTATIADLLESDLTFGDFFRQAPAYNPDRINITGKICGVQIENLEDPLMQEIRRLDKLVDWVAKGKTFDQIKEKYEGK